MDALFIIESIVLIGSNIALLPSIWYAGFLGLIPEVAIISVVFTVSTIYHLCQVGFVCILEMKFTTFQLLDQFFVYSLFVWMTFYFIGLELQYRFAILVVIQALLVPLLIEFAHTWWFAGIIIGIVVVIALLLLSLVVRGIPKFSAISMFLVILLLGTGFALHVIGGDPFPPDRDLTEEEKISQYAWFHSAWHVLAMLSVYYVLDMKRGESWLSRVHNFTSNNDDLIVRESQLPIHMPSQKEEKVRRKKKKKQEPQQDILTLNPYKSTKSDTRKKEASWTMDKNNILRFHLGDGDNK